MANPFLSAITFMQISVIYSYFAVVSFAIPHFIPLIGFDDPTLGVTKSYCTVRCSFGVIRPSGVWD